MSQQLLDAVIDSAKIINSKQITTTKDTDYYSAQL